MTFLLKNLDPATRLRMSQEVAADIAANRLYISPRLTPDGAVRYPALLAEAVASHDMTWLAGQIRQNGYLLAKEQKRKPSGGYTLADIPYTAADTLAEGEFNRFYMRGLCVRAMDEGMPTLTVYRAKEVTNARSESQRKIGTSIDPQRLLDDLRIHIGVDTALGLPQGPNSGLSLHIS